MIKLVAQFERYDGFRQTTDLVAVTTGNVASDDIRNDLFQVQEQGETTVKFCYQERLIKNETDVDALLERELSTVPALSITTADGKLRNCTSKANLSPMLQENTTQVRPTNVNDTCTIIDGMASVSDKYIRVDIVFDRYLDNSIKGGTRAKRKGIESKGVKRKVESRDQKVGDSDRFVTVDENKVSLAHFLCTQLSEIASYFLVKNFLSAEASMAPKKGFQLVEMSPDSSLTRRRQLLASLYIPGMLHYKESADQCNITRH